MIARSPRVKNCLAKLIGPWSDAKTALNIIYRATGITKLL
jgi:hypothetical protein